MQDLLRLTKIGLDIGKIMESAEEALTRTGITQQDLDDYAEYINQQESTGPVINPGAWPFLQSAIPKVKNRIALIRLLIQCQQEGAEIHQLFGKLGGP